MEEAYQKIEGGGLWRGSLYLFAELASTNAWALAQASACSHGDVVRAVRQTAGRGRFNRQWVSPGRCCLTLSAILKPAHAGELALPFLLPATALAVARMLEQFRIRPSLRWPNDVLVAGRKIGGILAEQDTARDVLVIGVGLNVNLTGPALMGMDFPTAPTSMAVEKDRLFDINAVSNELLSHLELTYDALLAGGPARVLHDWRPLDCLTDRTITVATESGTITGHYSGMQDNGQLRLVDAQGRPHLFWSGDVTIAR